MAKRPSGQQFEPGPPKWALLVPGMIAMAFGAMAILRHPGTRPMMVILAVVLPVLCGCVGAGLWRRHPKGTSGSE